MDKQIDPVKKAQLFGALFDRLPTYKEIKPESRKQSYGEPAGPSTKQFWDGLERLDDWPRELAD